MSIVKSFLHLKATETLFKRAPSFLVLKRWKQSRDHWAAVKRKQTASSKALEHFDDFYQGVFEDQWPSLRLGLLSRGKYCAVVNNYSDSEKAEEFLQCQGAINLKDLIEAHTKRQKKTKKLDKPSNVDEKMVLLNQQKIEEELLKLYKGELPPENVNPDMNDRLILPSMSNSANALYEFVPATKLKGREDWIPESEHFSFYNTSSKLPFDIEEGSIEFPSALKVYTFEPGNISSFPRPKKGTTGVSDFYLMDGSSILPVLALGLEEGDTVLDMCAAPGGKSLVCHQTLLPSRVVSNDSSISRTKRINYVLTEYLYNFDQKVTNNEIVISSNDGRSLQHDVDFNKILVDVPCTTDRHSVEQDDNNIFKQTRIKERIKLPELQTELLVAALKLVQPGGTVVYSTCSLSPIQNDGVVHRALSLLSENTSHTFSIKNLNQALEPYSVVFKFADGGLMRYGSLVLPYLPSNFGPTYFCKIVKIN